MPRILLTGHDGLLGTSLKPALETFGDITAPDLDTFDLRRPEMVSRMVHGLRPDLVVHLAAETRVDYCEEHPDEAFSVNVLGTTILAQECRKVGARLVMMSTDYVFDGSQRVPYREFQRPSPINTYGRSKAEAEMAVLSICDGPLIIRSSSVYGEGGRDFVDAILQRARDGAPLRVVEDQIQSPTWVGHLAPALASVIESDLCGILHLSGSGSCSWFEFAEAILSEAKLSARCEPISSKESGRPAPRPPYSVLDCGLAQALAGLRIPEWREGLSSHLGGENA